ncbi:hypothetical protein Aperf_G00000067686 [Anoplocephala perfoliata]
MTSAHLPCSEISAYYIKCNFNATCRYGEVVEVICKSLVPCHNGSNVTDPIHYRKVICRYCHQLTDESDFRCERPSGDCVQPGVARSYYVARCSAQPSVVCLGHRQFPRMRPCTHDSGKSYGTTVILSLFLGGLGADRFYLGMWREGLGKLFTFGGLGVWSVVDFVLVVVGYIRPSDDPSYWGRTSP